MKTIRVLSRFAAGAVAIAAFATASPAAADPVYYGQIDAFDAGGNVSEMAYSPTYGKLVVRNSGSAIRVIDLATHTSSAPRFANYNFTDMDLTSDGRYLFAADYGGENIGYGTPSRPHYVQRLDLATGVWESKYTPGIAGRIEAVSGDRFVLSSLDQWVNFTYNGWGTTNVAPILNTSTYSTEPGYYAGVYAGDIEYVDAAARIIHGSSGLSSQELTAFRITGTEFVKQESSGTYGSAQGFGASVVLSQDQAALYYGRLKVEALDVTHNLQTFGEAIRAATKNVAFGARFYYDAKTGLPVDSLGFDADVFALGATGDEVWVFNSADGTLRLFAPVPEPETYAAMLAGLAMLALLRRRARRGA